MNTASLSATVLAVVGFKNAGKTTLIERLTPRLQAVGIRVAMVKHHMHQDALDDPQRDTGRAAAAGAARTLLVGPCGIVDRIYNRPGTVGAIEGSLNVALRRVDDADLVFVEGFADSPLPKILVRRSGIAGSRRIPAGPYIATVGDAASEDDCPHFDWTQIGALAEYLRCVAFASNRAQCGPAMCGCGCEQVGTA
ncbi:MAG: molybdopterin-guanine dinucleotide biosynthesis protein B [Vulcanimicrobiaceae bacterium]